MKNISNLIYLKRGRPSNKFIWGLNFGFNPILLSYRASKFILMLILTTCSCSQNKHKNEFEQAYMALTQSVKLENYKYSLIIPRAGCSGCIGRATTFVIKNNEQLKKTLIVFTKVDDKKLLKIQLGQVLHNQNILIDNSDLLSAAKTYSIYPQLITLDHGNILFKEDFDEQKHSKKMLHE